ncbi:MFS general substrate transporter [Massarina eburnea CBS 473.64]|uniref:MFS general substrate transporter n=1 Tax=Massarina eburnea CBS 473.64 TaxID=1395130 RepID=A0A6A6RNI0_9PLEO|nr:MFS general substrate transporter [Massarina eburnea CBS 473.64]
MADQHSSRGPGVFAVTVATLACCTVFVLLRLISRFAIVRKQGWDDYTMILAWFLAFGTSFSICYGTTYGLGNHQTDVPMQSEVVMKKAAYAFSILYNPALMTTKTSILLFYLSLSKTQKIFRWATIATLVVVNVGGVALTLLNIFQCAPVTAAMMTPVPHTAQCTDIVTIYLSSAPLNIITDLAIFFLPMPILTGMRLPKTQKVILVITFGFGIFVAVVDVIRIYYLQDAQRDTLLAAQANKPDSGTDSRNTTDFSWYASLSFMWSAVEINIGIMVACVPGLKPIVRRFCPQWILDQTVRDKSSSKTSDSMALPPIFLADDGPSILPQTPPASPMSKPPPAALTGSDEPLAMMDFLTSPDDDMPQLNRNSTVATCGTVRRQNSPAFFDFVDMEQRKNITLRTNRESVFPIMMVTILFFIWGFAYGLLDTLNARFQEVAHMNNGQTIAQHSAYFGGYIVAPLTFGRIVFKTWGFKACYMFGLTIYACGTLIFWPSAVLSSFPAFLISNFIVGSGLSMLELGANPFIVLCGPPEYAEARLNLSQAIQATGTVVSPLLAKKILFKASPNNLIDVQWAYLGISFFTILLAVIYYYVPLPEATDEELETASARMPIPRSTNIGTSGIKVMWVSLGFGILSIFCYVGGQEAASTSFAQFNARAIPRLDTVSQQAIAHTAFATSRFIAAFVDIWLRPRFTLLFFYAGAIAFAAAAMTGSGATPAAIVVMVNFFEGPLFPLIYAQSLRGLGGRTKDAAVLLTAAIGGGGVFPPIMYAVTQSYNVQYAYCVVVAAFAVGFLFPVWLNGFPVARLLADPLRDEQTRRESEAEREGREGMGFCEKGGKRWSRIRKRWSKERDELPWVEHRERRSWPEGEYPPGGVVGGAAGAGARGRERHDSSQIESVIDLEISPREKRCRVLGFLVLLTGFMLVG